MTKYLRCIKTDHGHTEGKRYNIVYESKDRYEVDNDFGDTEFFTKEPDRDGDSFRKWFVLETEGDESMENVIEIDGVKYREVKRKAAVGEKIKIVNAGITLGKYENGDIRVVTGKHRDYPTFEIVDGVIYAKHEEYVVLEPITETADAEREIVDLIVLQRELNGLKRQQAELTKQLDGLTDAFARLASRTAVPTKPKSRDEIVAQAKRDVAELSTMAINDDVVPTIEGDVEAFFPGETDYVDFVVNRDKRTVVALIRYIGENDVWAKGIAKAAPGDVFNSHIGRAIALRRALGLGVPAEYTNAPQPEDVRVGDVVRKTDGLKSGITGVIDRLEFGLWSEGVAIKHEDACRDDGTTWTNLEWIGIIDDSDRYESEVSA